MKRTAVKSTDIAIIGYDQDGKILEVAFRSGSVYHYLNVSEDVFRAFVDAKSHGVFFKDHIREKYQSEKIA